MLKKTTLLCLFVLCSVCLIAQTKTTNCYHCYKHLRNDNAEPRDYYQYITFKGNFLYASDRDECYKYVNGMRVSCSYLLSNSIEVKDEYGQKWYYYGQYDPANNDFFSGDIMLSNSMYNTFGYLVSADKKHINYVQNFGENVITDCYERCSNNKCSKQTSTRRTPSPRY